MTLDKLAIGQSARIVKVGGKGALRRHLLDMGLIPGQIVSLTKYAPLGDPMELLVNGYSLSLRLADSAEIEIEIVENGLVEDPYYSAEEEHLIDEEVEHPGLGEEGRFHSKEDESKAFPKGTVLNLALAGNQNSGKTTLFNYLTGANQHVGNFPGVTIERKDGQVRSHKDVVVTDLPGIYSLSTYSAEELVSRNFILEEKPKAIINIVDAGNLERNLYLTMQLLELNVPMVLALNMMDEVENNRGSIRINEMEQLLGIPVVPISAIKNQGIDELMRHAVHVAKYQECPHRQDFCNKNDHGGAVHRCIHSIMHLVEEHAKNVGLPVRFVTNRMIEGDEQIVQQLGLSESEKETIESIIRQMELDRGLDRNAAMADMRFAFIKRLCSRTVVKPKETKEYKRSREIDRLLTGKYTALPIFVVVISLVIWLSIDVLGSPMQGWLEALITWLSGLCYGAMGSWGVSNAVRSLVGDGIFGGVGAVISFIPIIIILYFFLSLLEDSGYMARVAFVFDKIFRKLGLSGRSIVPLLIGFGCSVPAVMSTRTLPSDRDRKMATLLTPFISCSAKIPIYAFLTTTFFPGRGGLVLVILYLSSIFIGVLVALFSKAASRSEAAPFVMELPNYRMPGMRNVLRLMWDKTNDFLQRAFTVIFVACVVIWFLQSFDFRLELVEGQDSILAALAGVISPIFAPLGLGDWRIVTALITGFLAKEGVVSTLEVLGVTSALTSLTAIPMLAFCLLYTPCVAAIAAVRRELGGKWALIMVVFQCVIAWICAFVVYHIAKLLF